MAKKIKKKKVVTKKKKIAIKKKKIVRKKAVGRKKSRPKSVIEMSKEKFDYFMAKIAAI